ncbi:T9SS type A sorting domain-containing protein [bacterium]|nr:T9SS type A sorting domain-containing protein [bacterium]
MRRLFTLMLMTLSGLAAYAQSDCSDLYFSEYIEGGGYNKAVEIYNPTGSTIDLSNYAVGVFMNGASTPASICYLKGMLKSGDVYIIANSGASSDITSVADTLHNGVANFNGDDALVLGDASTLTALDIIGVVGTGTKVVWTVGTGSTQDHTLVRKETQKKGETDWSVCAGTWDVYDKDETSYLGSHTSDCISSSTSKGMVNFEMASYKVSESAGSIYFKIMIDTVAPSSTVEIEVSAVDGSAMNGTDYSFTTTTLTFTDTTLMDSVAVSITDNMVYNGDIDFDLIFKVTSGDGQAGTDTAMVTIVDDEYPMLSVKEVRMNDTNGATVWNGKMVWTGGIVNTDDSYGGSTLQYTIQSGGWGVSVYSAKGNAANYSPKMGDSIIIRGEVSDYNGLTEVKNIDSILVVSSGNPVTPLVVTTLDETTESKLITIENLKLVDPSQWKTSVTSFGIDVTDGTNNYVMYVLRGTNVFDGHPAPDTTFSLTGWGNQYDKTNPKDEGYQITPRNYLDINQVMYTQSIEQLRRQDTKSAVVELKGRQVTTRGVVNSAVNFNGSGLTISIEDNGWGLTLYGSKPVADADNLNVGDSIEVVGEMSEFAGLAEIQYISSITVLSTGLMVDATEITMPDNMYESRLVKIKDCYLLDTAQWQSTPKGDYSIDMSNGVDTFTMRLQIETADVIAMDVPTGKFDVTGILGQYDKTFPYDKGYQLIPRSAADFDLHVSTPEVGAGNVAVYPSPTNGFVYINSSETVRTIKVYNMVGANVKTFSNVSNSIDLSELTEGVYMLQGTTLSGATFTKKVVKK